MGCEASVDTQQAPTRPVESHLDQSLLPFQNQKASAAPILKQQIGPIVPQEQKQKQSEESKILTEAKRLEKGSKYTEAIELYLKVKDFPDTKVEALRGLGDCYRLKSMYDQSIKYSIQSFNLEKNQECCMSLGICYRNKKDYKSSLEWLSRGLEINPNQAQLHNALGITYKDMNEFQKAEMEYKKAVQLDSKYELGFERLAELYNDRNRIEQAISIYQKILQVNPKNVGSLFEMAVIYKNKLNKMDEAMKCLTKAIEIDPNYPRAYNTIGNIKLALNQLTEAEANFRKSIECDPEFRLPYNGLGNTLFARKLFKQAKQCYIKSIQKDPKYSTPYSGLGDANWKLGQLDKAIQSYLKSIQLNPKDDNPYNGIGNVYKTKGDTQQSIKWLKKAIEVNPKNENAYNGLGNAYKQLGMYDQAKQYYLKAIEVKPNFQNPYNGMANIYYTKKELDQAEEWYKKALEVDPNYDTVYNNLGNLYSNYRDNIPKAIEFYNKALSLNPKNQAAYNGLGVTYKSLGKTQQAIDAYTKAIECSGSYSLAYVNLALCYIKIENYPEAFKALKKVKQIIENADRDVFGGCKSFITGQLAKFDAEMAEWQYKSKMGYLTKEDIDRIQNLRIEFENKFKNLFSSSAENMEAIDPNQFRLEFMEVLDRIKEDGFTLSKIEQIADIDFKLFRQNPDDFSIMPFMFCKYFWEQRSVGKKSIKETEGTLDVKIGKLNELFPPSFGSAGESPEIGLKREVPEKAVNLFKDVEYFKDYRYLVKEIQSLHQTSHLVLPKFKEIIYKVSSECGGYHSKANLKLPEKENDRFKVYIRVMEKMFKEVKARKEAIVDKIDQRLTKGSGGGMQAVMGHLVEVWTEEISAILQARSKDHVPTICNITDLVRGKSMFKSAKDVETAANRLIDELDKLGIEIIEIDNRLKKETRDLVFKVLIDGIVCEYQMALETDSVQYNYSHCYYEIRRSPLGCIFGSYLFLSKYEILSFAKQAKEVCTFYKNKQDNEAVKRTQAAQFLIEALEKNI